MVESNKTIADIEQISEPNCNIFTERSMIDTFVEAPLIKACRILYDKNIRTLSSNANLQGQEKGEALIIVEFGTLSEKNKMIAQGLSTFIYDRRHQEVVFPFWYVSFPLEINCDTSCKSVEQYFVDIAGSFIHQELLWGRVSLEERKKFWLELDNFGDEELKAESERMAQEVETNTASDWLQEGLYFDGKQSLFYSEELLKKSHGLL